MVELQRYTYMQKDTVNIEKYSTAKIYLFQLQVPNILCLYSEDPFSCDFSFCVEIYINRSHKYNFYPRSVQG